MTPKPDPPPRVPRARDLLAKAAYVVMLALAAVLFLVVRRYGETLSASAPASLRGAGLAAVIHLKTDTLLHVLLSLVAIIVTARVLGALFRRLHQPPVIGEVVAGLLLGPSLLGRVAPQATALPDAPRGRALPRRHLADRRHSLHVPSRP